MCCVWILKPQRLNILLFFSQFKLTLLNHKKSLQLNFIILVLFSCGLLINSLFPVDSPRTYRLIISRQSYTWEHYLSRNKFLAPLPGIRQLEKHSTLFGEVFCTKFLHIFGNISPTLFFLSSLIFLQSFSFIFTSFYC